MTTTDRPVYPKALELLAADGPRSEQADKLMLYGQFVGSWAVHSTSFPPDDTRTEWHGEWHFAWILGGRGVQDVLLVTGAPAHQYGTTVRCYDEERDEWHVSFMAPAGKEFVHLVGRQSAAHIVQEVTGPEPHRLERWIFTDITPDAFTWRDEVSFDHGQTWVLEQEMRARRQQEVTPITHEAPLGRSSSKTK